MTLRKKFYSKKNFIYHQLFSHSFVRSFSHTLTFFFLEFLAIMESEFCPKCLCATTCFKDILVPVYANNNSYKIVKYVTRAYCLECYNEQKRFNNKIYLYQCIEDLVGFCQNTFTTTKGKVINACDHEQFNAHVQSLLFDLKELAIWTSDPAEEFAITKAKIAIEHQQFLASAIQKLAEDESPKTPSPLDRPVKLETPPAPKKRTRSSEEEEDDDDDNAKRRIYNSKKKNRKKLKF